MLQFGLGVHSLKHASQFFQLTVLINLVEFRKCLVGITTHPWSKGTGFLLAKAKPKHML